MEISPSLFREASVMFGTFIATILMFKVAISTKHAQYEELIQQLTAQLERARLGRECCWHQKGCTTKGRSPLNAEQRQLVRSIIRETKDDMGTLERKLYDSYERMALDAGQDLTQITTESLEDKVHA